MFRKNTGEIKGKIRTQKTANELGFVKLQPVIFLNCCSVSNENNEVKNFLVFYLGDLRKRNSMT